MPFKGKVGSWFLFCSIFITLCFCGGRTFLRMFWFCNHSLCWFSSVKNCDHLISSTGSWSLCWPSACVSTFGSFTLLYSSSWYRTKAAIFDCCTPWRSCHPSHEIMVLFVLRKLILRTHMCSNPVGLDFWLLAGPFVYFHTSCLRTAKALARLHRCLCDKYHNLISWLILLPFVCYILAGSVSYIVLRYNKASLNQYFSREALHQRIRNQYLYRSISVSLSFSIRRVRWTYLWQI